MYIRGGLLYELAYVVMEAEKSHNPPPASCSTRKASGVIQSEPEGLRISGAGGASSDLILKA